MENAQCPQCGATIRDLDKQNCEYCGSLFVRFIVNKVPMTNYVIDTPGGKKIEGFIFQGLEEAFIEAVNRFQPKNDYFFLHICESPAKDSTIIQILHPQIAGISDNFGFVIHLTFCDQPDRLKRFLALPESKLFARIDWEGIPCFTINYGIDTSGAAMLCSRLLIDVYGFKKSTKFWYDIFENGLAEKSWCFIATAAFGNNNHPTVILLRNFRDTFLLEKEYGRIFVRMYYRFSPPLARLIAVNKVLRLMTCFVLSCCTWLIVCLVKKPTCKNKRS